MQETEWVWMNGEFVRWKDAKVPLLSNALHYGSGVFEGMRCYETQDGRPAVFRLSEHISRLERSARLCKIRMEYSKEEIASAATELVSRNGLKSCYIRPLVFCGYGSMGFAPDDCKVETSVSCWKWDAFLGSDALEKGVAAKTSPWRRISSNCLPMQAKATGQYINSIAAKRDALESGVEEAVMLNDQGFVAEGPAENIFAVKHGALYTPALSVGILDGITRASIIDIAKCLGIRTFEQAFLRDFLYLCDEVFFCGTAAEITPVTRIDGIAIGSGARGPVTKALQERFFSIVRGKDPRFARWLAYVDKPQAGKVAAAMGG
jgi:branched-chain amino acid aminotransferase